MAKVTSKYQVTLPKAIADKYQIRPGDDIDWVAADDIIRVIPPAKRAVIDTLESRLRLFDQATRRIGIRARAATGKRPQQRGWSREDLYTRGRTR